MGSPKVLKRRKVYETYREARWETLLTRRISTPTALVRHSLESSCRAHREERRSRHGSTPTPRQAMIRMRRAIIARRKHDASRWKPVLKRLQTDYIDLYWVHIWDEIHTCGRGHARVWANLVRQGKVLYVGISDAPAWWVAQANTLAEASRLDTVIGLQLEYSLD